MGNTKEKNITLWEWLDTWLKIYVKPKVKVNTYKCYCAAVNNIKKVMPNDILINIKEMDIQMGINLLFEMGYSKSSLNTTRVVINLVLEKACKNGLIAQNVSDGVFIPVGASEKKVEALTIEERKIVEKYCYEDLHGILFIFLLNTGLRREEMCNLKWADYDDKRGGIFVRKSKTKSGIRFVPLIQLCQQIIMSRPKINDYIFNSTTGNPITASVLKKTYLRLRKATGINTLTNHVCRHTFATRLLENGADPKAICSLLGHSSVAFTLSRYTHTQFEYLAEQINLIA